ncbi:MAG TPA: fasciclin domain-containing protein [Puia sp.]|nr:fasciclin domain-containing protein [Puia sp.]
MLRHFSKFPALILLIAGAALLNWDCSKKNISSIDYKTATISYVLSTGANTTYFENAVHIAGLDSVFNGAGPFTVFVPNDQAFEASGISMTDLNAYSMDQARQLVLYHTVAGLALNSSEFIGKNESKLVTANGDSIFITADSNRMFVNGMLVTASDVAAANGVMNAMPGVLQAPVSNLLETIQADTSFSFLCNAISLASANPDSVSHLFSWDGPFTFLAPDNDAFRSLGYNMPQDLDTLNPDSLRLMILSQVIPQRLFSCDIPDSSSFQTVSDSTLNFTSTGISLQAQLAGHSPVANLVSDARMATNGVLFKVDEILLP